MTAPVQEPSDSRTASGLGYGQRQLFRRPAPAGGGKFVGIIFPSSEAVVAGDDAAGWFLAIPEDLDQTHLSNPAAAVYTPAAAAVEVQVRNVTQAADMLSTPITIDAGDTSSYTAGTPPVVDAGNSQVTKGDLIVVDVDDASDAMGLDIILMFA